MRRALAFFIIILGLGATLRAQSDTASRRQALLARAKALELSTPYVPPPGDPLEHHTAGYAKIMCSAVFITGLDPANVKHAIDAAFEPDSGMTAAFVVTWRGRLIGERYGEAITMHTPLESWSMGKSVTATLMGILIKQGVYDLWQPAPVPEWQGRDDPRAQIRIADPLHLSSGLRIRAPQDPDYDPSGPYPDHLYLYTGAVNSFHYAATRPLQWPPGAVGRYRNTDVVLINYLVRWCQVTRISC